MSLRPIAALVCLLAVPTVAAGAQALRVERDGRVPVTLTVDALRRLKVDTVSLSSHGAPPVRYRAVSLLDVMAAAGSPIDSLRLGHAGWIVAAFAKDGYIAVFSAAEIEPKLGPTRTLIAFERDGAPLADTEAPFHMITPTDKHGTRSARMVTTVRIFDALKPAAP
jgi:hypothetical protein